jgi:TRAP-type mannitol/chloroaromatic compound transport system permease small subunit
VIKLYTKWLEATTTWIFIALTINVFVDVVLRYVFNNPIIGLQELEWHLFAAMFLVGISYGLQQNTHVRVDIFYDRFSLKTQSLINIIGFFVFVLPISILIIYYGISFSYDAFIIGETSGDPGGLAYRFIIKSIIPLSFILVLFSGVIFLIQNIKNLRLKQLI